MATEKIYAITGLKKAIIIKSPKENVSVRFWTIKFSKQESLQLIPLIYYRDDLPCLKRKYSLAMSILESHERIMNINYKKQKLS